VTRGIPCDVERRGEAGAVTSATRVASREHAAGTAADGDVPDLTVVIPALNERDNLDLLLPALNEVVAALGLRAQVIVADGGSTDRTPEIAARWGALVVRQAEPGYGGALLAGFAAAVAPYVVTMDADLSHRPSFLEAFWRRRKEAEVLIASRYVPGGRADVGALRRVLSIVLNRVYARTLSMPFRDVSSGFRMYRRDVLAGLELASRGFDLLEELLIRVDGEGWRIREIPFHYMSRGSGRSHVRLLRFGWAYLRTLVRMWRFRNSVDAADYDYRAYDSPIWLQRYWQRTRHRIVLDLVRGCQRVLDIGCGSSRIVLDLPHAIGLDVRQNKLRWLSWRRRGLVRASCHRLPFADGSFDGLIHSQVIEHVADDPAILAECHRVLRPGGVLVLGTPDYGRWLWPLLEWVHSHVLPGGYAHEHITRFTRATLAERLRAAGFAVLDCRYVGRCEMIFQARRPALLDS
jgi:dolichol-phosphate mannosyltransferase